MESSNPLIDISFYPHDISACCCIVTVKRLGGGGGKREITSNWKLNLSLNTKLLDEQRVGPFSKVRDNAQCSQ